jgi:hypothetical protein
MVDETKRKKVVAQKRGIRKREKTTEQTEAEGSVALPKEAKANSTKKKKSEKSDISELQTTRKKDALVATEAAPQFAGPSYEQIRLRAYFISVNRRDLGLPGDDQGDWIQAETELREEMALEQVSA